MKFLQRLLLLLMVMPVLMAHAHQIGLSTLVLQLDKEVLVAQLTMARSDAESKILVDEDLDGIITERELRAATPAMKRFAQDSLQIEWGGRRVAPRSISIQVLESSALEFSLEYPRSPAKDLTIQSFMPALLPFGHQQDLRLLDEGGRTCYQSVVSSASGQIHIDLNGLVEKRKHLGTFRQFTWLGVEHILKGYDHLLFLMALLLAGGGFRVAVKIISSFTLAHSITLALATLHWIYLPSRMVEPLIALSIVYVGIENLFVRDFERRWRIAFVFGLIHGLGFAAVLRELGLGGSAAQIAVPLLSFNFGVELGQITIASLALPILYRLREVPSFGLRYVPACSVMVSLLGGIWFLQRTFV